MTVVRKQKTSNHVTSDGFSYLTKRILVNKAKSAGQAAAHEAMQLMGYVVTVKDGWLVKEFENGDIEQLHRI